jgi:preprotein translocase subunit SecF
VNIFSKLYRGQNDIDFRPLFRLFLTLSAVLILASGISLFTRGLNLAIDFKGGAVWEVPAKTMTVSEATATLGEFGLAQGSKVQEERAPDGSRMLRVQADTKDVKRSNEIAAKLAEKAGIQVNDVATNTVGPSWGGAITRQAVISLIVFFIVISLYMSWQLEGRMALANLLGVVHDIIITVGIYSIFHFEVTPATVVSFLTILGFSLYDTIVVFDRVKENSAKLERTNRYTFSAIMRRSLNQVLMRSLNTSFVAVLPVIALITIGAAGFDQPLLRDFSLALLIGLIAGAYSSLFIASPALQWLKEREPGYQSIRAKAVARGTLDEAEHIVADSVLERSHTAQVAAADAAESAEATPARPAAALTDMSPEAKAARYERPVPPRPRKQGRKR